MNVTDYDITSSNYTEYDNITSNNFTKSENNIQIVIPLITIIPCGMSLICSISLMIYVSIKPLITNKR